ncbi:hypothetical protein M1L60_24520 [Actinoplanes sp. TRM 88003]|uniref:Uncharacterized protein n=1 Tax=Paractinoplanes aksuensis TaxID=2939490 RepID=A0ABT1DSF3_9ACTN|nr:hypothetical protein [Actinoplanes aksuensis]MCO8273766.1 hypothetical protein [Actinoplanes aksuensis]
MTELRPGAEFLGLARAILLRERRRLAGRLSCMAADPALVAAYNEIKLRHRDDPEAYERHKSAFFDSLLTV